MGRETPTIVYDLAGRRLGSYNAEDDLLIAAFAAVELLDNAHERAECRLGTSNCIVLETFDVGR